jgi:hypothetical protein
MKKMLAITALLMMSSAFAQAAETKLCGILGKSMVSPKCAPGKICPHFIRIQWDIFNDAGTSENVETGSSEVFSKLDSLLGKRVCAEGTRNADEFEMTSISGI